MTGYEGISSILVLSDDMLRKRARVTSPTCHCEKVRVHKPEIVSLELGTVELEDLPSN